VTRVDVKGKSVGGWGMAICNTPKALVIAKGILIYFIGSWWWSVCMHIEQSNSGVFGQDLQFFVNLDSSVN
jgi:hypothetical protein